MNGLEMRRRAMMQGSLLPKEYQEVEYLQGAGNQYIDTGIIARSGLEAHYKILYTRTDLQQTCGANSSGVRVYFPYMNGNYKWSCSCGGDLYVIDDIEMATNIPYSVKASLDNKSIIIQVDRETRNFSQDVSAFELDKTLYLFASNAGQPNRLSYSKIYFFRLYDSATKKPLANYIPCIRKNDNKPGMYDTVSKTFLTNRGTGKFIVPS